MTKPKHDLKDFDPNDPFKGLTKREILKGTRKLIKDLKKDATKEQKIKKRNEKHNC